MSYNQAEPTSHERAELAERAVRSFVGTVFKGRSPTTLHHDDLTDAMSDLICDLMHYANQQGLSLPAVKSRLLRARTRLKNHLHTACAVRLDDQGRVCCYTPRSPQADSQLSVSPNDAPS